MSAGRKVCVCLHLVVVLVKVMAVLHKRLHVADELSPEVGLQGHQLVLHLRAAAQQFLPGVAQSVHLLRLLLGHRLFVFVEDSVRLLYRQGDGTDY